MGEPEEKMINVEFISAESELDPLKENLPTTYLETFICSNNSDDQILRRVIKIESNHEFKSDSVENSITKPCEVKLVDVVKTGYIDVDSISNGTISGNLNEINLGNESCFNCAKLEGKLQKAYGSMEIMRKKIDSLKAEIIRLTPPSKGLTKPATIKIADISKFRPIMTTKLMPQPIVPTSISMPKVETYKTTESLNVQLSKELIAKLFSKPQPVKLNAIEPTKASVVNGRKCKLCKVLLAAEEFKQHLCIGQSISCKYCQKFFTSTHNFLSHLSAPDHVERLKMDRQSNSLFKCDKCPIAYPMVILLECHKKSHCPISRYKINNRPTIPIITKVTTKENRHKHEIKNLNLDEEHSNSAVSEGMDLDVDIDDSTAPLHAKFETSNETNQHTLKLDRTKVVNLKTMFQCGKCNEKFDTSQELGHHMKEIHYKVATSLENRVRLEKCSICKTSLELGKLNMHLCGKEKSIQCEYCDEKFTSTVTILAHLNDNHEQKLLYKCDDCPKFLPMIFLKEHHMTQHIKIPREFMCDECPKAFTTAYLLKYHKKRHNMQKRDHLCDECGMSFFLKTNLDAHKRIHGVPKFQCPDCPRKFFDIGKLNRHMDIHQNSKYVCSICKRECRTKGAYNTHLQIHNSREADKIYECKICSKTFLRQKYLKNHYISHSNERRFKCRFCDASYKYKGDLDKHHRIHLDGKIHECKKCSESFYYQEELQKHLNKHYKEEKAQLANERETNIKTND